MNKYKVTVDRYDIEFDTDQPTWYGVIIAESKERASEIALSHIVTPSFRYELTNCILVEEVKNTIESIETKGWEY